MNKFDEERMDIIGQNGGEALHYEMGRVATLRYRHDMIDEEQLETLEDSLQTTPDEKDRSPGL